MIFANHQERLAKVVLKIADFVMWAVLVLQIVNVLLEFVAVACVAVQLRRSVAPRPTAPLSRDTQFPAVKGHPFSRT